MNETLKTTIPKHRQMSGVLLLKIDSISSRFMRLRSFAQGDCEEILGFTLNRHDSDFDFFRCNANDTLLVRNAAFWAEHVICAL